MSDFEATLQLASSITPGTSKFCEIVDKLRTQLSPRKEFPGITSKLKPSINSLASELLISMAETIFSNSESTAKQMVHAVDALCIASICKISLFFATSNQKELDKSLELSQQAFKYCLKYAPQNIEYCCSYTYNIAFLIYSKKLKREALTYFRLSAAISKKAKNAETFGASNKYIAYCLLSSKECGTDEFYTAVENSSFSETLLAQWLTRAPPSNPEIILNYVSRFNGDERQKQLFQHALPYFALHGHFAVLDMFEGWQDFFPNFCPIKMCYVNDKELQSKFKMCWCFYEKRKFVEFIAQAESLIKEWPCQNIQIVTLFGVFFLIVWLINAFFALGRTDRVMPYIKKLESLFSVYPFVNGLCVFYAVKYYLYTNDSSKYDYRRPLQMEFDAPIDWSGVNDLADAVFAMRSGRLTDSQAIFEEIRSCNNVIIIREAFHYYATSIRSLELEPDMSIFDDACKTSSEAKALLIYHRVISECKYVDISELWSFKRPKKIADKYLNELQKAAQLAKGYSCTIRKIRQLQALLTGTSNPATTADFISYSVSSSIDSYIPLKQMTFTYEYPILTVVYVNIAPFDPCILMDIYQPYCQQPLVVRIPVGMKIDDFLDNVEDLIQRSSEISPKIGDKRWWTEKYDIDKKLKSLISDFDKRVLGVWSSMFTPYKYKHVKDPLVSLFMTKMNTLISQNEREMFRKEVFQEFGIEIEPAHIQGKPQNLTLLLGRHMHEIPWEMLPSVIDSGISITRIPSMRLCANLGSKSIPLPLQSTSSFYVLNPAGDLTKTEERFKKKFKELRWNGFVKAFPDEETIEQELSTKDIFVFCGHGAGEDHYRYSKLVDHHIDCRSSMILMGCQSGALKDGGELDPIGAVVYGLVAGANTIVATLWDVTDGEIDRFFESFLDDVKNGKMQLDEAVIKSRDACKLKYLTGGSIIVYGFPALLTK